MAKEEESCAKKKASFGLAALILGMVAFAGSVGHFWLGPIAPPPVLEDTIADKAVKIRDRVVAKLKGDTTSSPARAASAWDADRTALAAIACTSVLAILLSVVAFVRHEPIRMVGGAAALGGSALALQYLVIAIGAIVIAIILAAVLNGLDFSP